MSDKILKIALILLTIGFHLIFSSCSDKCSIEHVEEVPLETQFDYILIADMNGLDSLEFIPKNSKIYSTIKVHLNKGDGFVFLTNGYKITGRSFYKGMMYISSKRTSSKMIYAAFFSGKLKGPYKFASPQK